MPQELLPSEVIHRSSLFLLRPATMTEVLVVVGWFLAPNIAKIIDLARHYAATRLELHRDLRKKLRRLAEDLQRIRVMVDAAGAEGMGFVSDPPGVGNLWRLKDTIHDAEEFLDEFHMKLLENQHDSNLVERAVLLGRQVFGNDRYMNQLIRLLRRLRRLPQNAQDLLQTSQRCARPIPRSTTGPMPRRDDLFGYATEYTELLSSLTSGGEAGVIAITGNAGMGKTELARRAFHDERIVKDFSLRLWVCVYGKFNETDLLKEIWMSALGRTDRAADEMNLPMLQQELTKKVESFGRKWRKYQYLLVLDDVCNDESTASDLTRRSTWETVLAPFRHHGDQGSRILITTRAKICVKTLNAGACIHLNGIDNQASMLLIKKKAFGDQHAPVLRELQDVLNANVDKLHGSPLAAEEVGVMLRDGRVVCNKRRWKEIMNRDHHDGVFLRHLSSYQDLPPHLQRCLAFCSIFPNKWRFEHEKLIMMWIALGLVQGPTEPNAGRTTEEDVGRRYFDDLLQRSLFQEIDAASDNSEVNYYMINEHIHSMLRQVCLNYYLRIDRSGAARVYIPPTVRHLSVTASCLDQLRTVAAPAKMRTLVVFKDDDEVRAIDSALLSEFKGVRVLDLSETCITELPDAIPRLRHVRYLGLPNTILHLGARFPRLLLLQTLYLKSIARRMASIGSLDKLQGSVEIHVCNMEQGYGMRELENLNSLRRLLCIKGLETVATREEAQGAQLRNKEHLKILKLKWNYWGHQQAEATDLAVLEGLQPHSNLEKLHITGYNGTTTPAWLEDPSVLGNLSSLYLRNCRNLLELPLVGRLDHLEKLVLQDMPDLESWDAEPGGDGIYTPPLSFTTLKEVQIINCPSLTSVSVLQRCTSLTDLRVHRCPAVRATLRKSRFPYLKKLDIVECPGLQFEESPGYCKKLLTLLTATIARNP